MRVESVWTHHEGKDVVHLTVGQETGHDGWIAIVDAAGVCLAEKLSDQEAAEGWLLRMFQQLYPRHECGLGCVREPGCHFLASPARLARLTEPATDRFPGGA